LLVCRVVYVLRFSIKKIFLAILTIFRIKWTKYTVAGKAISFAPEQPLHVVALAYSTSGILKWLQHKTHFSPATATSSLP
jgi:hypothetical protein